MKFYKFQPSRYINSLEKRSLDILVSSTFLILTLPLFVVIAICIWLFSGTPIFFLQKRRGLKGKIFKIIKFRSMIKNADRMREAYKKLNESDGPAFKIKYDPRFTKIGRLLSHVGLDELPQFINVLKGDMSIVGPRPLPVSEADSLNKSQKIREIAKPGITSTWVTGGSHKLPFRVWMDLDRKYIKEASFVGDIRIIINTALLIMKLIIKKFLKIANIAKSP